VYWPIKASISRWSVFPIQTILICMVKIFMEMDYLYLVIQPIVQN
jgi:hypothetical protein